ncbi:MAG: hypothetical protein GY937_12410 [bacterium]|nr:hypothetical protein [bacterium]
MHVYPTVYLILGLWVPLCILAFATMRPQQAALLALLGGVLLLPERMGFDVAGLPAMGKLELASLGAMLGCLVFHSRELIRSRVGTGLEAVILLAIPFSLATVMTNRDPTGGTYHWYAGLRPYDAASTIFGDFLRLGVPFVLGRALFRTPESLRMLVKGLVAAALAYSVLVLWEARMSPQLNRYLYGYGQHSFHQTRRLGGWRPMVFMAHGLALSVFLCTALMAAIGAHRAKLKILRVPAGYVAAYLTVVLLLCRSLASIVYGGIAAPLLLVARPRIAGLAAAGIALIVLSYPVLRATDAFPTQGLIDTAASVNEARAKSLQTRFDYEDLLLDRARERIWFGWGAFGRARYTDESARPLITDGYWIHRLGAKGVAGLSLYFVLVLAPIFQACRAIPKCPDRRDASLLAALTLILAIQALDTVPNALFNHIPLLMAGAVSGLAVALPRQAPKRKAPPQTASRPEPAPSAPTTVELAKGGRSPGARHRARNQ